jgi:ribonuclease D
MKTVYLTDNSEAEKAVDELHEFAKLCVDTETTGLQAGVASVRLLQLCSAIPTLTERIVYVFDLFKLNVGQRLNRFNRIQ